MDTLTRTQEIDLALVKRAAARDYIRKRYALRMLVKAGVFTPKEARETKSGVQLVNLKTTWRMARRMLKGLI